MTVGPGAHIVEIFFSLQGEGILVGVPQLFIRFAGCNLACAYCDTLSAMAPGGPCRVEQTPGSGDFVDYANPLGVEALGAIVRDRLQGPYPCHSLALTGGEPLLHGAFLSQFLPSLPDGIQIYLETNGTLWRALKALIDRIDMVSMDVKLPSATGQPVDWQAHRRFLGVARGAVIQVKLTFADMPGDRELQQAVELVAEADPKIPIILQPVYGLSRPVGWVNRLLFIQARCLEKVETVRVIPQTHKLLKIN